MFLRSFLALLLATPAFAQPQTIDFNRDVRPILSGKCFQCHGPDDKVRQAGLRFDLRDGATKVLKSGTRAIVPGDPSNSEMVARISSKDSASSNRALRVTGSSESLAMSASAERSSSAIKRGFGREVDGSMFRRARR